MFRKEPLISAADNINDADKKVNIKHFAHKIFPYFFLLQRLGCDNMLESPQQEDPCLQCGGNGQSCYRVKNSFSVRDLPTGTLHVFNLGTRHQMFSIITFVTTVNFSYC